MAWLAAALVTHSAVYAGSASQAVNLHLPAAHHTIEFTLQAQAPEHIQVQRFHHRTESQRPRRLTPGSAACKARRFPFILFMLHLTPFLQAKARIDRLARYSSRIRSLARRYPALAYPLLPPHALLLWLTRREQNKISRLIERKQRR
jgi:predicted TIM-barrel fold metal-dependent hydrolase